MLRKLSIFSPSFGLSKSWISFRQFRLIQANRGIDFILIGLGSGLLLCISPLPNSCFFLFALTTFRGYFVKNIFVATFSLNKERPQLNTAAIQCQMNRAKSQNIFQNSRKDFVNSYISSLLFFPTFFFFFFHKEYVEWGESNENQRYFLCHT